MILDRYIGFAYWATLLALSWLMQGFGQVMSLDTVDRWLGGSIMVTAGVLFAFFTLKFSANQRDSWTALLKSANEATALANDRADSAVADYKDCAERCAVHRLESQRAYDSLEVKYDALRLEKDM